MLSDTKQVVYRAVIPLNPTTKKNSLEIRYKQSRTGRAVPFISQGEKYRQYERDCGYFLRLPQGGTIDYPVNVRCIFYRDSNRRVDLTNLEEAIDDILVTYRILADDTFTIVVAHDGSRVYVDKDNPRTEIYIERLEE